MPTLLRKPRRDGGVERGLSPAPPASVSPPGSEWHQRHSVGRGAYETGRSQGPSADPAEAWASVCLPGTPTFGSLVGLEVGG